MNLYRFLLLHLSALIFLYGSSFSQNVGIGTVLPAAKLDVRHTSGILSPTLLLFEESPVDFARLQFQNASGNKFWHVAGYIDHVTDANSRLNFFHSVNGDVMSLTGDGKVGIGTVFPTEKLSVVTGYGYGISHEALGVKLATYLDSGGGWIGTTSNHPFYFYTNNGGAQMTLLQNGNVGIGVNNPTTPLEVVGTVKATDYMYASPKTRIVSIGGLHFRTEEITDVMRIAGAQGYCWMENGTNPLFASVQFPQDAIITSFIVYCTDNTASENLIVRLRRGHGITSISDLMAEAISSGVPGNTLLLDNTISYNPVDNVGNFYFITAESSTGTWTNSDLAINQIQINYTLAGPQ